VVEVDQLVGVIAAALSPRCANITNSGRTPAKNYRATANLAVFDNGIPNGFRYPDRQEDGAANSVLGPQAKGYIQVDLFVADAVAIYEKRKEALIYGWIEYDDVFPDSPRHRTELCATVEVFADPRAVPQIQSGEGIPIMTLRPYGKYNAYDGDCLYQPGETPVAREGELPALTPPPLVNQPRMDI
jgi:hypothetical protein